MREIKFRVWDKQQKIMREVDSINFPLGKPSGKDITVYNKEDAHYEWVYDYKLMQYTEIKDMNGIEIYEGDIVVCDRNIGSTIDKIKFEVMFDPEKGYYAESYCFSEIYGSSFYMSEVVGNIYENNDLLKK